MLKARMGEAGRRVPTGLMPDWVIWLASYFDTSLKQLVPILGQSLDSTSAKAKCDRHPGLLPSTYPNPRVDQVMTWYPGAVACLLSSCIQS